MKEIIINDILKEEDITEIVKRVKIILINKKEEILLGYSNNMYQFPGGHVEANEELVNTVNREIQEETGIELNLKSIKPFAKLTGYYKDYPTIGNNRKNEIYYYEVKTDKKPNLNNTNYTESELKGKFELRYINLDNFEEEIINNMKNYEDSKGISSEMISIIKIYKSIKK
ncbi:MAG: NUDIX hydrolase [Bacilli bacterium]|nr:NUDIX hydrolase [Bacilli bacterium]